MGMSRIYSADPLDRKIASPLLCEVPEDDEEDDDETRNDEKEDDEEQEEEENDEEGDGYSE